METHYISKGLRQDFPNMTIINSTQTSNESFDYNCIAWALEINNAWFWPDDKSKIKQTSFWPKQLPNKENRTAFVKLFELYGFRVNPRNDCSHELSKKKIAIYFDSLGKPTHAARQLPNGNWTSKIGDDIDIEHKSLEVLEGPAYGKVGTIMEKNI
jgi:hypothetical protein